MTQQEIIKCLEGVFEEPPGRLGPDTRRDDVTGWDSMGVLALMAELDSRFDIIISPDEMAKLKTIGDILDLLRSRGKVE